MKKGFWRVLSKGGVWMGLGVLACLAAGYPAYAALDHVVISQIQIGTSGSAYDEFVELYNPTDAAIDLSALPLKLHIKSSGVSDSNKSLVLTNRVIPSRGFYLIGLSGGYAGTVALDAVYSTSSSNTLVSNGGVYISTSSSADVGVIDRVGWGLQPAGGVEGAAATSTGPGMALFRKFVNGEVSDSGDNSADFVLLVPDPRNSSSTAALDLNIPFVQASTSTPDTSTTTPGTSSTTPGTTATTTPDTASSTQETNLPKPDTIKISEIVPNPAGTDSGSEAVELVNTGTSTVSLDGWYLDDKTDGGIKAGAHKITGMSVSPGGFVIITIPAEGAFTLNNTGGDAVNLYFPDQTLADSVSYADSAPEGKGWQQVDGVWMWAPETLGAPNAAPPPPAPSGGGGTVIQNAIQSAAPATVQISEFLPNPIGDDEGSEWVELYNLGTATASLAGFKLDDGTSSSTPGSSAYALENASVPPLGYIVIHIPRGKFTLNNTGGDGVRLFGHNGALLEKITYGTAPEGESYGLSPEGVWRFGLPTAGSKNFVTAPVPEIAINELLPYPGEDDVEFIELFNSSSSDISLENFKIVIGESGKILGKITCASGSYLTLYEEDLPAQLRNGGQMVALFDNYGRKISEAAYGKSEKGGAYAWTGGGFVWTEKPTPGAENELVLGASAEGEQPGGAADSQPSKSSSSSRSSVNYAALYRQAVKDSQELRGRVELLESEMEQVKLALANSRQAVEAADTQEAGREGEKSARPSHAADKYLYASAVLLVAVGFLLKRYVWKQE